MFSELLFPVSHQYTFFPDTWKTAYVIPLFKNGSRYSLDNYRAISLLPEISIAFEHIAFKFIYLNVKHKSNPKDFGFQSKKNCTIQLVYLEQIYLIKSDLLRGVPRLLKSIRQGSSEHSPPQTWQLWLSR